MPRPPRRLPAQNTLSYLLLTLTALCGEYPISQISHLPGGSAYLESVVTALRRDGLLRTFSKDGLRGLRLTSSAKRLLLREICGQCVMLQSIDFQQFERSVLYS